MYCIPQDTTLQ